MKASLYFSVSASDRHEGDIVRCLARAGVAVGSVEPRSAEGAALLVFDECRPASLERLRGLIDAGHEYVLAIAAGAAPTIADTWRLLDAGASDVLAWNDMPHTAAAIAARVERWQAVEELITSPLVRTHIVGRSTTWKAVLRRIVEIARFTAANVLVLGESGTGKELAARLIHTLDPRPDKRELVIVDCTTIVPALAGSEFFGHERGAFTGASHARDGAFALANGGTLFLDEVADLPLQLQAQLLRVVQEHTYKRVGGNAWERTEFRLVCATNKDLPEAVRRGEFRHDLYHRVANWSFTLPPLRERRGDIVPLVRHFIGQYHPGEPPLELDDAVKDYLLTRGYPGNVRDLRQLASRIVHRHVGRGPVTAGDIPADERPRPESRAAEWRDDGLERSIRTALSLGVGLKDIGRAAEDCAIHVALSDEGGNLQRAARRLGVTDRALQLRRAAGRNVFRRPSPDPPQAPLNITS